ncbi:MAG: type II toxin-antitoxin system RelB/DinJ family antitoxin [Gammaproteobacteria bacterium]|nr:type II toxin-antitoxin system RelB/DinJ family antitoxin [Gammaproteobacteria bacterium]
MNHKTDRIQTRIDPDLKESVEAIFSQLGLSSGEAIRLFYSQVELTGGLPFPVQLPNSDTIEAIKESQTDTTLSRYQSFSDLRKEEGI